MDQFLIVVIVGQLSDERFESYDSVGDVDSFREPEKFLNVPCFVPIYWWPIYLVLQYMNSGMLLGSITARVLQFSELLLRIFIPARDLLYSSD